MKTNIQFSRSEMKTLLYKKGWSLKRNSGPHEIYSHPEFCIIVALPRHEGNLAPGTARKILKQIAI